MTHAAPPTQYWLFLQLSDLALIYNSWDDGLGQTGSSVLWFVGMNLSSGSQSLHYCQGYNIIFHDTGERNRGYALLMMANKLETVWTELTIFLFYLRHLVDLFMHICVPEFDLSGQIPPRHTHM